MNVYLSTASYLWNNPDTLVPAILIFGAISIVYLIVKWTPSKVDDQIMEAVWTKLRSKGLDHIHQLLEHHENTKGKIDGPESDSIKLD